MSCARDVAGGSRWRDGRWRGRAPGAALPSACGFPAVSIICRNGHCEMLSSVAQRTVPCGLCPGCWCGGLHHQRTQSVWLRSLASRPRRRPTRRRASPAPLSAQTVAGWSVWADILLDVIGGGSSALREGCPRTMTGVSQHWFSGHFRQVFSTPMHYPALTLAPTCGANRAS